MFNFPLMTFEIFAVIAIASAFAAVMAQNAVRAVLALVVTFFAMSVIWLLAHAEFLALVLVLVYVGAVMTLFLFVLMMLNLKLPSMKGALVRQLPMLVLMLVAFIGLLYVAANHNTIGTDLIVKSAEKAGEYSNTKALGTILYIDYVLAFEVAGALLLLAIIAAITLTHQPTRMAKRQEVRDQISVRREDRVRLVSMPSETEGEDEA